VWTTTQAHTYNYAGGSAASTTANQICTYTLRTTWGFLGLGCPTSGVQTQPFTVWDKENNTVLGTLDINHRGGVGSGGVAVAGQEITDICEKDQTPVRVQDASDFNCTAAGGIRETVRENNEARWIQWVYGTTTNIVTGPGATEKFVINGVSYTTAQLPVYGNVTYQAASTTTPLPSITDGIIMPTTALATQTFEITMRSWNFCNPLDLTLGNNPNPAFPTPPNTNFVITGVTNQPSLLASYPSQAPPIRVHSNPVTRTYNIRIITKPPVPVALNKEFCNGTVLNPTAAASCGALTTAQQQTSFELTAASIPSSTTISWYFGNPLLGGAALTNTGNGTNCRFFRPSNLGGSGAQLTMKN
jgi:hypothetical protein